MSIYIRRYLFIVIAAAAVFTASASYSADSLILEEIKVEGTSVQANEDNLTVREVRESSAKDIGEALLKVEGMNIIRKGGIANDVVLRGFQKDNLNVLVDGVRLYGGCPNRMDPPAFHVDFAEVDRIAVIKGPFDVTNPGGMGGQVNIVTKSASPGFGADAGVVAGSFGGVNVFGTASLGTDTADILGGYSYKYSRAPRSGDGKRITEIYKSTDTNRYTRSNTDTEAYRINTLWTKAGVNTTPDARMEVSYSYQDARHVITPYLAMDAMDDTAYRVNWTYVVKKDSGRLRGIKTQFFWDNVNHMMDNSLRVLGSTKPLGYSMRTDTESEVYGAKASGDVELAGGVLGFGADYYNRNWLADNSMYSMKMASYMDQPMIPDVTLQDFGLFTKFDRRLSETLELSAGIRGDIAWADADGLTQPRIAALYQPYRSFTVEKDADFGEVGGNVQLFYRPADEVELFAGAGRAVRMPDPSELYIGITRMSSNFVGNPALRPTKNHEVDLGGGYYTERYYVRATVFYSYLDDYINVTQLPDPDGGGTLIAARSYENVDAWMAGGELGAQLALPLNLYLNGSLSYTYARNETAGTPLSEIPPLRGMAGVRYDDGMFIAELFENMAASQGRVDPALNENKTGGWATTNFKAGVGYRGLTFFAGVDNVFDEQYYSHLSYQRDPFSTGVKVPETGRSFYVMLTYKR